MNLENMDKTLHDLDMLSEITDARRKFIREIRTECLQNSHDTNLDEWDHRVSGLDQALHDLGMLSEVTEARREYLKEESARYRVMRLNTRYVSNVTVGYCMKRATNKNRLCPYVLPLRHRTKSENSDVICSEVKDPGYEYKNSLLEPSTSRQGVHECANSPAKRCQSLEDLNLAVGSQGSSEISPEMDCVSTRIQKLHVDE